MIEFGYNCTPNPFPVEGTALTTPSVCTPICNDSYVIGTEVCDSMSPISTA
jgi:hypothetical protein